MIWGLEDLEDSSRAIRKRQSENTSRKMSANQNGAGAGGIKEKSKACSRETASASLFDSSF